ncbi:Asp23/Gls24 family envelope stress response protein [Brevibacterium casei]|nr:Asp23/Gls24 family envelope stress response protein [Brevibacterium casei]
MVTDKGNTTIAENVVAKLAGIAAREVPGVFGMGNAARRAFDTLTDRIPGSQTNVSGGVSVEKGEKQTAIDLTIVVEYGTSIVDVAEAIRRNVIRAVEQGTGLQVVEVNIDVTDVHLPDEDNDDQKKSDDQNNLS